MKHRLSVEKLAKYELGKLKPGKKLDLATMVTQTGDTAHFVLRIFNSKNSLHRVYVVISTTDSPIDWKHNPIKSNHIKYFEDHDTNPPHNFYIMQIQLDKNLNIHKSKTYPMPEDYKGALN